MATFEELSVKAILPETIKKQIDDGSLKIEGLQLRDLRGKYTTPLDTLMVKEDRTYSPALMIPFQNEFLVTLSLINRNILTNFREQSEILFRIERKLDQLLTNEMDRLNSEVNFFSPRSQILINMIINAQSDCYSRAVKQPPCLPKSWASSLKDISMTWRF
ncbi:hypothetical protein NMD10_26120 (plasmid) [Citrobacter portucalensis]|uniref:hypothetical protein n=1 Tax=Citrobacter portucalensis TaxID=1639133 RepID=UPI00351D4555